VLRKPHLENIAIDTNFIRIGPADLGVVCVYLVSIFLKICSSKHM